MPKRVLVITPQYAPDFGPSAPIYTALCEDLQHNGCDVTVITAFPHYADAVARFGRPRRLMEEAVMNGVRIIRTYVYVVPKGSLWRRLLYHASFNIFSTFALLRTPRPDIVIADAPTLWSGLPLLARSILPGVPFIYVIHDIYPDVLSRLGVLNDRRILGLIDRVERFFYRKSAQISVLSRGFMDNLLGKGVPREKITIIPVCVDTELIKPMETENVLRERWGLTGQFVVLYAGNIGLSQGLETLLETARMLRDRTDISFVIVGEGAMKPRLQEIAAAWGLSNVRFFPFQPREDVPFVYDLAHVCLILLKRDIVIESVPSKTYSIMSAGRAFIATVDRNTEVGALVDKARCGVCVEPENAEELRDAIIRLAENPSTAEAMGRRGRDHVVTYYSRDVAAAKYHELIMRFAARIRR